MTQVLLMNFILKTPGLKHSGLIRARTLNYTAVSVTDLSDFSYSLVVQSVLLGMQNIFAKLKNF